MGSTANARSTSPKTYEGKCARAKDTDRGPIRMSYESQGGSGSRRKAFHQGGHPACRSWKKPLKPFKVAWINILAGDAHHETAIRSIYLLTNRMRKWSKKVKIYPCTVHIIATDRAGALCLSVFLYRPSPIFRQKNTAISLAH